MAGDYQRLVGSRPGTEGDQIPPADPAERRRAQAETPSNCHQPTWLYIGAQSGVLCLAECSPTGRMTATSVKNLFTHVWGCLTKYQVWPRPSRKEHELPVVPSLISSVPGRSHAPPPMPPSPDEELAEAELPIIVLRETETWRGGRAVWW